ncbi:MAG: cobalamin-binding protein [Candidatus Nezhaarchaeota archaeon]|nr:cobalamin-binding protein [Candidatus Nezhaarchaeota archaeon]MCX8141281.1 cobalamin-binding protein [Candidatus Nezhaarchaeota archaeon]MDW8049547.1 cobalamin-binding protein [Nitrososphaerota archaeon]
MNSRQVLAILIALVVIEAIALGYMVLVNSQLADKLSEVQGEYQKLLEKYHMLTVREFPITLTDRSGKIVVIASEPRRIVSLSPAITEILFALGLGDRVVGVTAYCNYPLDVEEMKKGKRLSVIGGYWDPNLEAIVALNPDLVIGDSLVPSHLDVAERLRTLNITVLLTGSKLIEDVFYDINLIGKATGRFREAQELVAKLEARIKVVVQKVANLPRAKVYYELWFSPLFSAGPGTFIDQLIFYAGGKNIFHDAKVPWPVVSDEDVIARNPDVIILPDTYMSDYNVSIDSIKARPGWSVISAIKNNRVYFIEEDIIVRPGPRLVEALEIIARYLHPEAFRG